MNQLARRAQPSITIRSARAVALLQRLTTGGRSQVDIIEEALERLASQRKLLSEALAPVKSQDFSWEPIRSNIASHAVNFED